MSSFKDHCPDENLVKSGVKLPLFNKDGGVSDDYLMVRWAWDDHVRAAVDEATREGMVNIQRLTPKMDAKTRKAAEKNNADITAKAILETRIAQIAGWSFDEKLTKANVMAFFKARPDVADRVDSVSEKTKLFFGNGGKSS